MFLATNIGPHLVLIYKLKKTILEVFMDNVGLGNYVLGPIDIGPNLVLIYELKGAILEMIMSSSRIQEVMFLIQLTHVLT
jgi:hypothetical protein